MTTEYKIRCTQDALKIAFNTANQAYERPMMNRMAAPATGSSDGLAGLDAAAQAGMILHELEGLGSLYHAVMVARWAPKSTPCACRAPCCAGSRINPRWVAAVATLADWVRTEALQGCHANGLMRREYVVRFFTPKDQRPSLDALADQNDIDRKTASAHYARVANALGGVAAGRHKSAGLEREAFSVVDTLLREIGMVGE